jgi:hypothetical protein
VPAPADLDPAAQARFQRLWAAYPEVGRLTANRDEALARFAALSPADQDRAVAAAPIEARKRAEVRSAPLSLHHWLRKERWRNVELPAGAAGAASEAPPTKVFVREGSPEWDAWAEHHRRLGRPMPTPIRFDSQRAEGWRFESLLPPTCAVA